MNNYARAARARALIRAAADLPPATFPVRRFDPPEIVPCRWPECRQLIELVETEEGGLLPLHHPFDILGVSHDSVTIAPSAVHLAVCPAAPPFLQARWTPSDGERG